MTVNQVQAEITAALRQVSNELGTGPFVVGIRTDPKKTDPWTFSPGSGRTPVSVPAMRSKWTKGEKEDDGILESDFKVIISAEFVVPKIDDVAIINRAEYKIKNVMPSSPAGEPLYYTLQLRR